MKRKKKKEPQRHRCPICGTRRTDIKLLLKHVKEAKHHNCNCGGYHYPHNPRSRLCERNPKVMYWIAWRADATEEELFDILLELSLEGKAKGRKNDFDIPF